MGVKFLAPMLYAAAVKDLTMRDVLHWLDTREDDQVTEILEATGVQPALDLPPELAGPIQLEVGFHTRWISSLSRASRWVRAEG
jgi:hypothetical protein